MESQILIITSPSTDPKFNKVKDWYLKNYTNRVRAKIIENPKFLQEEKIYDTTKVLFLPEFSYPNLGAYNLDRIDLLSEANLLINLNSQLTHGKDIFIITGKLLSQVLRKEDLILETYEDFQTFFRIFAKTHSTKRYVKELPKSWNYIITNLHEANQINPQNINIFHFTKHVPAKNLERVGIAIYNKICDWVHLNNLRFRNVPDYLHIFDFTGRNKIGCKEIAIKHNIPVPKTYQVLDNIKQLNWKKLPKSYVIKPTNLDGARKIYAVHDGVNLLTGKKLEKQEVIKDYYDFKKKQSEKELNYYLKDILEPQIIVEEFISNSTNKSRPEIPYDYKCYVFRGILKFILVIDGSKDRRRFSFYDRNWKKIPNSRFSTVNKELSEVPCPKHLSKLVKSAETLGKSFRKSMNYCWEGDFIRIDFYSNDNDIYFGEFAIFPNGAKGKNVTENGIREFAHFWLGLIT